MLAASSVRSSAPQLNPVIVLAVLALVRRAQAADEARVALRFSPSDETRALVSQTETGS
jgi:hypothetical protein